MKIGLVSDLHYSSAEVTCGVRRNSLSLGKLRRALEYFAANGCGRVILLGDITDTEPDIAMERENLRQIARELDAYPGEVTCLMGNHDAFVMEEDEFYGIIGESHRPRLLDADGVKLVFIDACYYSDGSRYAPGGTLWQDTFCPKTEELAGILAGIPGDVYVFMHQNIDPDIREDHRLSNAAAVRSVMENAGNVRRVYQGHYHPGNASRHNGIEYITLPALCENAPEDCILIADTDA